MENTIGIKIKKLRELKNIGQQYMAEKLHISQSSYSDIENGKSKVSEERLEQIAQILEISTDAIKNFNDSVVFNYSPQSGYINTNHINPLDQIQQLYERLLKDKDDQILILKNVISDLKK